jgi:glycine oxidase
MEHNTDVLIVGAGVIGSAIAYNLRKRGIDVMVLDREETDSQASSAAAGLLAPLGPLSGPGPFADLLLTSFSLFPSLVPEPEEASGLQLEYEQTGALRTVRNPKRVSNLKKRLEAIGTHHALVNRR